MTHDQRIEKALQLQVNAKRIIWEKNSHRDERVLIRALTDDIFGKEKVINKRCGDCWGDALYDIFSFLNLSLTNNTKSKAMDKKFQLKEGKLLMGFGQSIGYTPATITDEYVIKQITRMGPAKAKTWLEKNFEKIPENWAELAGAPAAPAAKASAPVSAKKIEPTLVVDPEKIAIDYSTLSRKELAEICTADPVKYPREEWKTFNQKSLASYVAGKNKKAE